MPKIKQPSYYSANQYEAYAHAYIGGMLRHAEILTNSLLLILRECGKLNLDADPELAKKLMRAENDTIAARINLESLAKSLKRFNDGKDEDK